MDGRATRAERQAPRRRRRRRRLAPRRLGRHPRARRFVAAPLLASRLALSAPARPRRARARLTRLPSYPILTPDHRRPSRAEAEQLAAAIAASAAPPAGSSANGADGGRAIVSQFSPFRTAVVRALGASSTSLAGEPCALDALVANADCLGALHAWLDDCRAACLAAVVAAQSGDTGSAALANGPAANEACVALLAALVKLPVTVKVRLLAPRRAPRRALLPNPARARGTRAAHRSGKMA